MTIKDRFKFWLYGNDYNAIVALVYIAVIVTGCFLLGMVCGCGGIDWIMHGDLGR
jgi:hypothetical protein